MSKQTNQMLTTEERFYITTLVREHYKNNGKQFASIGKAVDYFNQLCHNGQYDNDYGKKFKSNITISNLKKSIEVARVPAGSIYKPQTHQKSSMFPGSLSSEIKKRMEIAEERIADLEEKIEFIKRSHDRMHLDLYSDKINPEKTYSEKTSF